MLSWIKAQWPLEVQQRHDEINAQYRKSPASLAVGTTAETTGDRFNMMKD